MGILTEAWKTVVLRPMQTTEAQYKMFQKEITLATGLKIILMIFWQKNKKTKKKHVAAFVLVLRISLRLS